MVYNAQGIAQGPRGTVYLAVGTDGLLEASWGGGFWKLEAVPGVPKMLVRSVLFDGRDLWFTGVGTPMRPKAVEREREDLHGSSEGSTLSA